MPCKHAGGGDICEKTKNGKNCREWERQYKAAHRERTRELRRKRYEFFPEKREQKKATDRRSYWRHVEKRRAECRRWHSENRDRAAENKRIRAYGLDLESWNILFSSQGNRCRICQTSDPKHKLGWSTDHDKITGKVRGILCPLCNTGLGSFGHNPNIARAAATYLERCAAVPTRKMTNDHEY